MDQKSPKEKLSRGLDLKQEEEIRHSTRIYDALRDWDDKLSKADSKDPTFLKLKETTKALVQEHRWFHEEFYKLKRKLQKYESQERG